MVHLNFSLLTLLLLGFCTIWPSVDSYCGLSSSKGCPKQRERGLYSMFHSIDKRLSLLDTEGIEELIKGIKSNMTFRLYNNRENLNETEIVQIQSPTLFTKFKPELPTKIIIHGWKNNIQSPVEQGIKNAYLQHYSVNVICVDWSGSSYKVYHNSRKDIRYVAPVVASFIDRLYNELGLNFDKLHIIGHSLGAHISGMAARQVKTGLVSRITGLDPADPLFKMEEVAERLGYDAADFVEVLHTCGKKVGARPALGHVDLYPNGGDGVQVGCGNDVSGSCSHSRAVSLYIEAVTDPKAFVAYACQDWATFMTGYCLRNRTYTMGENVNRSARGNFYFRTNSQSPFGLGEKGQDFMFNEVNRTKRRSSWSNTLFRWVM